MSYFLARTAHKRSFSHRSFPEILSIQVSQLVKKLKEESAGKAESDTRRQLRDRITLLSQPQLARATDALAMIWNRVIGPLDLPTPEFKPEEPTIASRWNRMIFSLFSNRSRVKLALLKSISTGTFVDVQFCAHNAIKSSLPLDLKPFFTSSIVIRGWATAIATRKSKSSLNLFHSNM